MQEPEGLGVRAVTPWEASSLRHSLQGWVEMVALYHYVMSTDVWGPLWDICVHSPIWSSRQPFEAGAIVTPFYRWEQWSKERPSSCWKSHVWESWDLNPVWFRPRPLGSTQCLSAPLPKEFPQRILSLCSNWCCMVHLVSPHSSHNPLTDHMLHLGHWAAAINASVTRPGSHPHRTQSDGRKTIILFIH